MIRRWELRPPPWPRLLPLALLAAALEPQAATAPSAPPLSSELAADDECAAEAPVSPDSCAIHALQRRGLSLATSVESGAGEAQGAGGRRRSGEAEEAQALQESLQRRFRDRGEVRSLADGFEPVCVKPAMLPSELRTAARAAAQGLPPWRETQVPSTVPDVAIAFLIQVAWIKQLPVVRRVFDRLYSPKDVFLFLADRAWMTTDHVADILPKPLPENVMVQMAAHAPYFMWPRVEVVLQGLLTLLQHDHMWDFALHLSESDYPVHSIGWIRSALASQRSTNFIHLVPRCQKSTLGQKAPLKRDRWYWWAQSNAVSSCAKSRWPPSMAQKLAFPMEEVEESGLKFARGVEWVGLTRELVKYALSPELMPFRKLIGMHQGRRRDDGALRQRRALRPAPLTPRSDEMFWQSLVINIPNFTQTVSQRGWYIQWGHGKTSHSPDTLTERYRDSIIQSRGHLFFMRKVTPSDSLQLLDDIDALEEPPALVQSEISDKSWLQNAVACPKGTGLGNSTATCRTKSRCGCPPYENPLCDVASVLKHPYCSVSQRRCSICEGTWC